MKPDAPLPDHVPTLQDMVRQLLGEVGRLRAENEELRRQLDAALKHRFGRRSERKKNPSTKKQDKQFKLSKRTPHGRGKLPEHLERRVVIHDLTEAEKLCPCCGKPRECIGEQTAEQLDMEPIRFFVLRTIKKTYACQHCAPGTVLPEQPISSGAGQQPPSQEPQAQQPSGGTAAAQGNSEDPQAAPFICTAGPPQVGPIAKGMCAPGLLAHVITAKFADHTPVHRLAEQLRRSGVNIARSTLGGWLSGAADLLEPLYKLMKQRLLLSRVLHSDDTGVKLRVAGADKTKKGHMWLYIGEADYPYCVYDFTADYGGEGPQTFLKGYKGYLQADALAQYEALYGPGKATHVCCWAHSRRKFVAAAEGGDELAKEALALIGKLYAIDRDLPPLLPPSDDPAGRLQRRQREEERRATRQQQAGPILAELKKWLDEHKGKALPKSALGQAIGYALNNWEALKRYVEQGYLAIDNNLSERTLRAIALGRNNWGVIGSEAGGKTAAVLYTMVATCKHLGIDPFAYLREALPGLFALGEKPTAEQLQPWLPDRWLLRKKETPPEAKPG